VTRQRLRDWLGLTALLAAAFASGCVTATGGTGPALPEGETLSGLPSKASGKAPDKAPETDALLAELYGPTFEPVSLKGRIEAALAAHPGDPDLQEAAGFLASLEGDADAAELHMIRAALAGGAAPLVYLSSFDADHAVSIQASQILAESSKDPEVRAAARRSLMVAAFFRGDLEALAADRAALGLLSHWHILGAFDNAEGKGFNAKYGPERGIDFMASYPGVLVPIRWRTAQPIPAGYGNVRFDEQVWPNKNAVSYAVNYFSVPNAAAAVLWLSTNAPLKVYVDGKLALSHETVAGGAGDKIGLAIDLAAGPHALLVKSANKTASPWFMSARLVTPDGAPLPGLVEADEPPAGPLAGASFEEIPGVHDIRPGLAPGRAHLLAARMALRAGDPKLAVREAAAFAEEAPDNPLALWALYSAASSNEEQGKALDLLNDGVKRFGDKLPRFYTLRARAYLDKGLLEKAQTDAESFLRLRPHDLGGELLLADVEGKRSFALERCHTLRQAFADHPRERRLMRDLAGCLLDNGQVAKARALLDRARALAPGDDDTLHALVDLERRAYDTEAAAELATLRRSRFPDAPGLWIQEGELAERLGRSRDARDLYVHAEALSPDNPNAYSHLAALAYDRGDTARAIGFWSDASERDPANGLLSERLEHLKPTKLGFIEKLVPTDEAIDAAVADGAKRVPQPGSHTTLLLDDEVTEVHADGSATRVVTTVTRAVNDSGRDQLIQARVPKQGRLKVLKAYAISPSGERQESSSVHAGEIRFRKLTVGSTVVLQYVHYSPAGHFLPNEFIASWKFQGVAQEHVLSRWTLVLPQGRKLHVEIQGAVQHTVTEDEGHTLHRFEARDVPPFIEEPFSPPLHDLLASVSVSTVDGWEDYARWERALLSDAFQESGDLGALAKRLTEGAKTPRERLDKLTSYVAEQIRYQMDYENTVAGVRPHSSRQVMERGYADCKDKAVFLISLAREVGIKVEYALLRTRNVGKLEREVPNQQFNHAITYVPKQEGFPEPFFVDATTNGLDIGNLRDDDQGATSLVLDPVAKDGFEFIDIPFRPSSEEHDKSAIRLTVDKDDKVKLTARIESRGARASSIRRTLKNPAYARKLDEQLAAYLFPTSTLLDASAGDPSDIWQPMWVSLDVDDSNALDVSGVTRRLRLPSQLGLDRIVTLSSRNVPLHLGVPRTEEDHLTIELPRGSKLIELPKDFSEEGKCFSVRRTTKQHAGQLDVDVEVVHSCDEISPREYPDFRAHALRVLSQMEQQVAFAVPANGAKVKTAQ
jgi:cellulose synthase operon protein C